MSTLEYKSSDLYLCNPFTCESINLHSRIGKSDRLKRVMSYGFGVSKITGLYKAVWIHQHTSHTDCMVYTIGTRSWRSIGPVGFRCSEDRPVFVNGNLHWFGHDTNDNTPLISCFDLETELFTTSSLPPIPNPTYRMRVVLAAAEGSLCLCDSTTDDVIIVWLMKEYGAVKSWTKEFVITDISFSSIYPIRVSKDGVILKPIPTRSLLYYSSKNKTTQEFWRFPVASLCVFNLSHPELSFAQTFQNGGLILILTSVYLVRHYPVSDASMSSDLLLMLAA